MIGYGVWALGVVRSSSTRGLELQNAAAAILAGVVLLLPPETLVLMQRNGIDGWPPEPIWGLSFVGVGVAQMAATLYDWVVGRRIAAALLAVVFALFALGIFVASPFAFAPPIMVTLAAGQAGAFWQARRVP